jgi:hypothetical protein
LVQSTLPVTALYFPATHAAHGPPLGPVYPALHVQFVDTVQALHEAPVFSEHVMHAAVPDTFLNFPAWHATHRPPFGPVYPGLHEQLLSLLLFAGEFEFAGHNVHAAILAVSLYVPTAHTAHGPPLGPV